MSTSDEARVLSAHYAADTLVNHYPCTSLSKAISPVATTTDIGWTPPTLSSAMLAFLAERHEDITELVRKPTVTTPAVPDNLTFKHYFISASHNTYLLGWQLFGHASAAAYTHVLRAPTPARCIEIDVWWDARKEGGLPVVTHGWTFSKSVPFVDVCKAIAAALDTQEEGRDWPVLISLECHVPPVHQEELVRIMVDCWGERLAQAEMEGCETLTPEQFRGRIVLMVEYYPDGVDVELDEGAMSESEQEGLDRGTQVVLDEEDDPRNSHSTIYTANPLPKIADSLANLGFYARSMKPHKEWWDQVFPSPPHPPHIILNVSERHLPSSPNTLPVLLQHATHYLRRIYPRGTRLTSSNLDPWVQWRNGTHIACLNWQRWDEPMWLNEAMFAGTGGWVVRPSSELAKEAARTKFVARIVGVSTLPRPKGDQSDFLGYCQVELIHRDGRQMWQSNHVRGDSQAISDTSHSPTATADEVVHLTWDQAFEWFFDADPLTFLLLRVVRHHAVRREEDMAVFCVRMDQLATGWCLVRLLDMRGKYVGATLLCEFTRTEVAIDDGDSNASNSVILNTLPGSSGKS